MTREEIIEAISEDKMMPYIEPYQLSEIVDFVIKNYKPSLPSNLDEACQKISEECYNGYYSGYEESHRIAARMGAEWMAGQGETRIVCANADFDPHGADYGIRSLYIRIEDNIPVGTKFIVQIRKK